MTARNARGWPLGSLHGRAKLTEEKVLAARREYRPRSRGKGVRVLARKYECAMATMRDILNYTTWPHVVLTKEEKGAGSAQGLKE